VLNRSAVAVGSEARASRHGFIDRAVGWKPCVRGGRSFERLSSFTMSGTYAEPGTGVFRTERFQLICECQYCRREIVLDGTQWRHQSTGEAECQLTDQAVSRQSG
jgi:hypothetical protein